MRSGSFGVRTAVRVGWAGLAAAPGAWVLLTVCVAVPVAGSVLAARLLDPRFGDRSAVPLSPGPLAAEWVAAMGLFGAGVVLSRGALDQQAGLRLRVGVAARPLGEAGTWAVAVVVASVTTVVCLVSVPLALVLFLLTPYVAVLTAAGAHPRRACGRGLILLGRRQPRHAGVLLAAAALLVAGALLLGLGLLVAVPVAVGAIVGSCRALDGSGASDRGTG